MERREQDVRVRRTREWIVASFHRLVLKRPYDSIHVGEIIDGAGVGRSTFYEHFRDKDALLAHSMAWLLGVLADGVTAEGDAARIRRVLDHFMENRRVALSVLEGASSRQMAELLAAQVENRLKRVWGENRAAPVVPVQLAAVSIAESQLAMVRRWLQRADGCGSSDVAEAILRSSRAAASALVPEG